MKNIRKYIDSFIDKKVDKYGNILKTRIEFVNELPKESAGRWGEELRDSFRCTSPLLESPVKRINDFIAIERGQYNAGAWGFCHYNQTVYVRKDIWTKFHINPFVDEDENVIKNIKSHLDGKKPKFKVRLNMWGYKIKGFDFAVWSEEYSSIDEAKASIDVDIYSKMNTILGFDIYMV